MGGKAGSGCWLKLPFYPYGCTAVQFETVTFGGSLFILNIAQEKSSQCSSALTHREGGSWGWAGTEDSLP